MSAETIALRLGISLLCGVILGWERESHDKPAGLRTITLVCLGSTLLMLTGIQLMTDIAGGDSLTIVRLDILRVLQGIVTGIGFLGAGTVIRNRDGVEGLTTAATIWISGAIGITVGAGYFLLAGVSVVLTILVLLMKWLKRVG